MNCAIFTGFSISAPGVPVYVPLASSSMPVTSPVTVPSCGIVENAVGTAGAAGAVWVAAGGAIASGLDAIGLNRFPGAVFDDPNVCSVGMVDCVATVSAVDTAAADDERFVDENTEVGGITVDMSKRTVPTESGCPVRRLVAAAVSPSVTTCVGWTVGSLRIWFR